MIAVGGDDMIGLAQRRHRADAAGFVAAVKVQVDAGDALFFVEPVAGLFEFANQHHLPIPVEEHLLRWRRHGVSFVDD